MKTLLTSNTMKAAPGLISGFGRVYGNVLRIVLGVSVVVLSLITILPNTG